MCLWRSRVTAIPLATTFLPDINGRRRSEQPLKKPPLICIKCLPPKGFPRTRFLRTSRSGARLRRNDRAQGLGRPGRRGNSRGWIYSWLSSDSEHAPYRYLAGATPFFVVLAKAQVVVEQFQSYCELRKFLARLWLSL